jgi:hypothetical protein
MQASSKSAILNLENKRNVDDRGMILHEGDFEMYLFGSYNEEF